MQLVHGNMWRVWDKADLFLITTNSTVRDDGRLVMGRGIAKEACSRFSQFDIAMQFGQWILRFCPDRPYGLIVSPLWTSNSARKLGCFQVKHHWSEPASLELIQLSTNQLIHLAQHYPDKQMHLNFPGVGNGKLTTKEVLPIISALPNNVTVWQR